jgi:hypothetical protein
MDNLIFLGQIVIIGSRIQANEIVSTEEIYGYPGLTEKVENIQLSVMEDQVP